MNTIGILYFYCSNNRKGDVTVNKVDMNNIRMFLFNESRNIFLPQKNRERENLPLLSEAWKY